MSDIYLLGATYPDVPAVDLPKSGGGTARFFEAVDGDELEYGTAGLAGTTWYFNSSLTLPSDGVSYSIDFTSNSTGYTQLSLLSYAMTYAGDSRVSAYIMGNWQNQAYRTISITGGTDATNADLIAWIQANATQQ